MQKNEFHAFKEQHAADEELNIRHIDNVIPFTCNWNPGTEDENDTADVVLEFEDGHVHVEAIRSNGEEFLLLDSWREI